MKQQLQRPIHIKNRILNKKYLIPSVALLCIIGLLIYGPIPQDQHYHDFADKRELFGIPNFLDVITNLPFTIVGFWGLVVLSDLKNKELKQICFTLFSGFLLLTFGSAYYHLLPNNERLVYDRIPIVVIVLSFFSFIVHDRIDIKIAYYTFIILNIAGTASVIYWILSEHRANGDLRWYAMMQFYPIIAIPLILLLYKSSFNQGKKIVWIFLFFALAKLCERFDKEIYHVFENFISGHSLKHLLMVAAGFEIVLLIKRRAKTTLH